MTYIEFFDKTSIENIGACLTHVPERVILIVDNKKKKDWADKYARRYETLFADRGYSVLFLT